MKKNKRLLWLIPAGLLAALVLCLLLAPKSKTAAPTPEEPTASTREEPTASTREEPAAPAREEPAAPARGEPALSRREALPAPQLVEEESFFSDFAVRGDRVYFLCRLCIRNGADQPQAVQVTGDFSEDAAGSLLAGNGELHALRVEDDFPGSFLSMSDEALAAAADRNADGSLRVLPLPPGDKVFWVLFVGDHGTAEVKQNRLLPPISIRALPEVTPPEVLVETGCRIFKDPEEADSFLLDGRRLWELGSGFGGYGLTSAVPWDYDGNGTVDLLYTYSWGSGMHRSHLSLFDRTKREEQMLYVYYPWDENVYGSDLVVEHETDSAGNNSYPVFTVDVSLWAYGRGYDFTELSFTKRAEAGVVDAIWNPIKPEIQPLFWPASRDFFPLTEEASAADPPNSCEFYMADIFFTLTGEKAAELLDFCQQAEKQADVGDFYILNRSKPLLKLIFTWDDGNSVFYQIDWKDKGIFGTSYANAQAALQFPAGTYDALLAMWGEPGDPVEEAEALNLQDHLQYCLVTYGGGTIEVSGGTAQELYRICRGAMELGELISPPSIPAWESSPPLRLAFRVIPSSGAPEDTDFFSYAGTFLAYRGFDDDFALFSPNPYASINAWYRFPAGTYDALMEALTELGEDTETIPLP